MQRLFAAARWDEDLTSPPLSTVTPQPISKPRGIVSQGPKLAPRMTAFGHTVMPLLVRSAALAMACWVAVSVRGELGDRIVTAMSADLPAPDAPVVSVAGAIARMEAIAAALPAADGLACFNRMYLDVTRQVNSQLGQGFFADPAFMTRLDVAFANLYFAAADTASTPAAVPLAWRPLAERRAVAGIEPVQFALAGMNAHINHDLPLAMVSTCAALGTAPQGRPAFR